MIGDLLVGIGGFEPLAADEVLDRGGEVVAQGLGADEVGQELQAHTSVLLGVGVGPLASTAVRSRLRAEP
ncbi:hypothetical protein EEJ42_15120 [Streptomyces botrytidirepellens]|uniref:Uncharacterized protein n=1 Tax=Streptomyces botrytidirepellens TaxID=2486417 RepID=A0A3M8WA28_9ACTN|nr:hypothetical protein EEJ42_15120 [Streptomyces botrytidirepellens]